MKKASEDAILPIGTAVSPESLTPSIRGYAVIERRFFTFGKPIVGLWGVFYTKKMMSASKSRLAFNHFEEDGRLFCDEPSLMELCPCPGDGLFISTNNGKKRRHCIYVE